MSCYVKHYDNIINRETRSKITSRYKRITSAINREFWNNESDVANSLYVGSYGRNTAISTSDIDILIILPNTEFDRFNNLKGNAQSRLLQVVKRAISKTYPNSDIRADGQIVKISFSDGVIFEVLPAFKRFDGMYVYPDSNMGGNWVSTNPKAEQERIKEKNKSTNGLLVATCRHMRFIRDNYFKSYHLSGIVIDSFVYNAVGNWQFLTSATSSSPIGSYEEKLYNYYKENNFLWDIIPLRAPGSEDVISTEESKKCLEKVLKYMVE